MEKYGRPKRTSTKNGLSMNGKEIGASIRDIPGIKTSVAAVSRNQCDTEDRDESERKAFVPKKTFQRPRSGIRRTSAGIIDAAISTMDGEQSIPASRPNRPKTASCGRRNSENSAVRMSPEWDEMVVNTAWSSNLDVRKVQYPRSEFRSLRKEIEVVYTMIVQIRNAKQSDDAQETYTPPDIQASMQRCEYSSDPDTNFTAFKQLEHLMCYAYQDLLLASTEQDGDSMANAENTIIILRKYADQVSARSHFGVLALQKFQDVRQELQQQTAMATQSERNANISKQELERVRLEMTLFKDTLAKKLEGKQMGLTFAQKEFLHRLIKQQQMAQDLEHGTMDKATLQHQLVFMGEKQEADASTILELNRSLAELKANLINSKQEADDANVALKQLTVKFQETSLNYEANAAKREAIAVEKATQETKATVLQLRSDVQLRTEELSALQKLIADKNGRYKSLKDVNANLKKKLDKLQSKLQHDAKKQDNELGEVKKQVTSKDRELARLIVKLGDVETINTNLEHSISSMHLDDSATQGQIESLRQENNSLKQNVLHLTNTIDTYEKHRTRFETNTPESSPLAAEMLEKNRTLEQTIKKQSQEIAKINHSNEIQAALIKTIDEESKLVQSQIHDELKVEKDERLRTDVALKAITLELETANLCLSERRRQRDAESVNQNIKLAALNDEISKFKNELASLKQQHAQLLHQKECELSNFRDKEKRLLQDVQKLEKEILAMTTNKSASGKFADELRQRNSFAEAEITSLRMQHDALELEYQGAVENVERINKENEAMSHCIESLKSDKKEAISRAQVFMNEIDELKSENETNRLDSMAKVTALGKELEDLQREHRTLILSNKRKSFKRAPNKKSIAHAPPTKTELNLAEREKRLQSATAALEHTKQEKEKLIGDVARLVCSRISYQLELVGLHKKAGILPKTSIDWNAHKTQWAEIVEYIDDAEWNLLHLKTLLQSTSHHTPRNKRPTTPFSDAIQSGRSTSMVAKSMQDDYQIQLEKLQEELTSKAAKDQDALQRDHKANVKALHDEIQSLKQCHETLLVELREQHRRQLCHEIEKNTKATKASNEERVTLNNVLKKVNERCRELESCLRKEEAAESADAFKESSIIDNFHLCSDSLMKQHYYEELFALRQKVRLSDQRRLVLIEQRRTSKLNESCGSSSVRVEK